MRRLLGREARDNAAPRQFSAGNPAPRFIGDSSPSASVEPGYRVALASRVSGRRRGRRVEDEIGEPWILSRRASTIASSRGSCSPPMVRLRPRRRRRWPPSRQKLWVPSFTIVYVGRLPNFLMQDPDLVGPDCKLYGELERDSRERLRRLVWQVKVAGGTVAAAHLRMGWPGREIARLGEEIGAGMIVVGSRGRGRLRRAIAGSVSDSVVRHARCPVLVVSPGARRGSSMGRFEAVR